MQGGLGSCSLHLEMHHTNLLTSYIEHLLFVHRAC